MSSKSRLNDKVGKNLVLDPARVVSPRRILHFGNTNPKPFARTKSEVHQKRLKPLFADQTAVTTKMVRHRGRSPRGERLVASVPHGHWKTLTLIAALRIDGLTAPFVMDGPSFLAYVEQMLAPTLAGMQHPISIAAPAR